MKLGTKIAKSPEIELILTLIMLYIQLVATVMFWGTVLHSTNMSCSNIMHQIIALKVISFPIAIGDVQPSETATPSSIVIYRIDHRIAIRIVGHYPLAHG